MRGRSAVATATVTFAPVTLRMADGPVANLPPGMDAYAGYVNKSGIGETYPAVATLAAQQHARAFSITTDGIAALCADVESGAMSSWSGYTYGYCAVSSVNALIAKYGRPQKLWTAHYNPAFGAHICSPSCWPGLVTTADGTQWTNHGAADWDESLLSDDFFVLQPLPPQSPGGENMIAGDPQSKSGSWTLGPDGGIFTADGAQFYGSMAGNRFNWTAVGSLWGIAPWWDGSGWGYKIVVKTATPGNYAYYRFPTNGSLRVAGALVPSEHPAALEAAKHTTLWSPEAGTLEAA